MSILTMPLDALHARLKNTVAMVFLDRLNPDYDWIPVASLDLIVLYLHDTGTGIPEMRLIEMGASVTPEGKLRIGGIENMRFHMNPAIGRRRCPKCWISGKQGYIKERGVDMGHCDHCTQPADYLQTAFEPLFYYYAAPVPKSDEDKDGDADGEVDNEQVETQATTPSTMLSHVTFNSREQGLSDALKGSWLIAEPSPLILPRNLHDSLDGGMYTDCKGIAFNTINVFSREKYNLIGNISDTEWDFLMTN